MFIKNLFKRLNIHITVFLAAMIGAFFIPSFSHTVYASTAMPDLPYDYLNGFSNYAYHIFKSQYKNSDPRYSVSGYCTTNKAKIFHIHLSDDIGHISIANIAVSENSFGYRSDMIFDSNGKFIGTATGEFNASSFTYSDKNLFMSSFSFFDYGIGSDYTYLDDSSLCGFDKVYSGSYDLKSYLESNYKELAYKLYYDLPIDGLINDIEPGDLEESDFWIENLQSYEKRGFLLSGIETYITWDSLNLNDFPDVSNLIVESKIDFTTESKSTHATNSYTDVPLFEGIPDTDGQYKFTNYDFLNDYCSKNGIDDSMLLYQTDKIYCRYKYTRIVNGAEKTFYTPWQGTGDSHSGINNPAFDESIDIGNLKGIIVNNDPQLVPHKQYKYKFTWDTKESYDENTYMVITADIEWKPTPGKQNSVNNISFINRGDLKASDCEIEFYVSDAWKQYFEKEEIDYSVFTSQWVENFYFQIYKNLDGEWKKSNIVRFNLPTQSIQGGFVNNQGEHETGIFNPDTGEWIPGSYDETGKFIPELEGGNSNHHIVDMGTGEITDKDNTNIGDWGLPEGMTVIDYIKNLGESFVKNSSDLFKSVGQIPQMIGQLFPWIPIPLIAILGLAIIACILLRILGR